MQHVTFINSMIGPFTVLIEKLGPLSLISSFRIRLRVIVGVGVDIERSTFSVVLTPLSDLPLPFLLN